MLLVVFQQFAGSDEFFRPSILIYSSKRVGQHHHKGRKFRALFFDMGKKQYCGECKYLKYEDAEGYGWCELMEEADVNVQDEACVHMEEKKEEEYE